MKKRYAIFTILLTITLLFSGCYPTGENTIYSKTENSIIDMDISDKYQSSQQESQLPDNIIFDMDTPQNIPGEIPAIKLTQKIWSSEEIENLFLDKTIVEKQEHSSGRFPSEKFIYWKTKDGFSVVTEPGRLSYYGAELDGEYQYGSVINYANSDSKLIDDCYATNNELSAFSRADAEKRAEEMFLKLGINNFGTPRAISVNCDFANKVFSELDGETDKIGTAFKYTPWTENEEIYILRYPLVYENRELAMECVTYPYSDGESGGVTNSPGIIAAVSKNKILKVEATNICLETYETPEKMPVNCDANNALANLKEYLSNLTINDYTKYYGCKLVYIPYSGTSDNLTIMFKPAWEFTGYEENDFGKYSSPEDFFLHRIQLYMYFWADTGHRYIEARD